jgi:hypothetical protein
VNIVDVFCIHIYESRRVKPVELVPRRGQGEKGE